MAKKQNPKRTFIPTSGARAFAELHDEIAAVSDELLVSINVDISYAHRIALWAADRIDELMPKLEKLPDLDMQRIRKLRMYAAACQHAHLVATAPEAGDPRLSRLLEECAKLRAKLIVTAEMLVEFDEISEERVAVIRSGSSHADMASSLEQLGLLFAEIWDRVESRIPVTAEMVERAPDLAFEINALLGAKAVRVGAAKPSEAQSMRQRAFTLLVKVYEECQSAVEYVRRREGDGQSFTPSLFTRKKRVAGVPREEEPETDVEGVVPIRLPITELAPTG
jgi:hypothetical protein